MWRIDGFKTKKEAQDFQRKHGGLVCWEERTPKRKELTALGSEYMIGTQATGIDREKYPFAVTRRV